MFDDTEGDIEVTEYVRKFSCKWIDKTVEYTVS